MTLNEIPPWLQSALCVAGLALGVSLHLAWHPLRRHFSDGYDFMRTRRLPLWITIVTLALEGWRSTDEVALMPAFLDWPGMWVPWLKESVLETVTLLHEAVPPLPLAVLLPVWVIILTVQMMRFPYRYQKGKLRADQRLLLLGLSALTLVWSAIYVSTRGGQGTDGLEMVMQPATLLFGALGSAAYQVWLARVVIQWAHPRAEEVRARDECLARWQNVLWLGVFHALWSALRGWIGPDAGWLMWSSLVEVLFVFAALPIAVAEGKGSLMEVGGRALRAMWRGWLPLLGWMVTAVVLLALGRYAVETSAAFGAGVALVMRPLVIGLLHAWLLPSAMLMLYRRGFPSQDQPSP